jgi:hypothetical protein
MVAVYAALGLFGPGKASDGDGDRVGAGASGRRMDEARRLTRKHKNRKKRGQKKGSMNSTPNAGVEGLSEPRGRNEWVLSRMVPFAGRMAVEKLACSGDFSADTGSTGNAPKEYVRVLVNDAVQPLEFCGGVRKNSGLCELEKFVESQAYARSGGGGDWERCFE